LKCCNGIVPNTCSNLSSVISSIYATMYACIGPRASGLVVVFDTDATIRRLQIAVCYSRLVSTTGLV
jgi:hypothetical protein